MSANRSLLTTGPMPPIVTETEPSRTLAADEAAADAAANIDLRETADIDQVVVDLDLLATGEFETKLFEPEIAATD